MGYITNIGGKSVGMAQPGRFGTMVPNSRAPGGANKISVGNQSPNTTPIPWYESGAVWALGALFVGYLAVYRTLR